LFNSKLVLSNFRTSDPCKIVSSSQVIKFATSKIQMAETYDYNRWSFKVISSELRGITYWWDWKNLKIR